MPSRLVPIPSSTAPFHSRRVDADPDVMEAIVKSDSTISMTGSLAPGAQPGYPAMARRVEAIVANHAALYAAPAPGSCAGAMRRHPEQAAQRVALRRVGSPSEDRYVERGGHRQCDAHSSASVGSNG